VPESDARFPACRARKLEQRWQAMNPGRGSGTRNLAEVRRVLIVDDNHDSAELLSLVLGREGHETRVAYDPQDAIPLAEAFCPHVAFLDIGLPGMDGFQLLEILRRMPGLAACQFVAVTGYEEEVSGESSARGFDAHLLKPIDLNTVVSLVLNLGRPELSDVKPVSA
jgi:CheY-like chemotaxis protein